MPESRGPPNQTRRVVCAGCQGLFDASRAAVGEAVACPHCGDEIHIGPPRRSRRRVRRSHAVEDVLPGEEPELESRERIDAPAPAYRLLAQDSPSAPTPTMATVRCAACGKPFGAPRVAAGDSARCPHCDEEVVVGESVREKHRVRRSSANPALSSGVAAHASAPEVSVAARCAGCGNVFEVHALLPGDEVACEHCGERLIAGPPVFTTRLAGPRSDRDRKGRRLFNVFCVLTVLVLLAAAIGVGAYYEYIDWFSRPESVPR